MTARQAAYDYLIKLLMIGDSGTFFSILFRVVHHFFFVLAEKKHKHKHTFLPSCTHTHTYSHRRWQILFASALL